MNNPRIIKYEPGKNKTNHPIWLPVKFHIKIDNRRINIPRKIELTLFLILVRPMPVTVLEVNSRHRPGHSHELIHQLRERRIAKGWSQQTLAVLLGVHTNEIHRWENKHHLPNSDTFIGWLELLDFKIIPPDYNDYQI
jgi:DNA-binding XRE family transcriptional regulator